MKKRAVIIILFLVLLMNLVSASIFSDIWNKITGFAVSGKYCTDTDGGINPNKFGTVDDSLKVKEDMCWRGNPGIWVDEYYCDYKNKATSKRLKCENYCEDGVCKKVDFKLSGRCYDEDDLNYYKQSKTFSIYRGFISSVYEDWCNKDTLYEYYCDDKSYDGAGKNKVGCENGCENGACKKSLVYDQKIKFFIDPDLVTDLSYTKKVLVKYVRDLNIIYSKTTNRNFIFDPEKDINISNFSFSSILSNSCTYDCNFPSDNFEIWAFFKKGDPNSYPLPTGAGLINGKGIIGEFKCNELYDPDNLTTSSEDNLWWHSSMYEYEHQLFTMTHELAHVYGVAIGEYYSMSHVDDTTGIEPITNINLEQNKENDPYWGDKQNILVILC